MTSQPMSPLPAGQVLEISFATFTPRITIHSARELTVELSRVTVPVSPAPPDIEVTSRT
jgi:hypothetical protein